jgi:hypothetical protein
MDCGGWTDCFQVLQWYDIKVPGGRQVWYVDNPARRQVPIRTAAPCPGQRICPASARYSWV